MGRTPNSAHTSQPWLIHDIASDFELEDVWVMPTPGAGADDFTAFVEMMSSLDLENGGRSRAARALFAVRWALGRLFSWDDDDAPAAPAASAAWSASLRDRLTADLASSAERVAELDAGPFSTLYCLDREYAAELVNSTMHGVVHLSWVADGSGGHRGQMAVLVKPNGRLGRLYLALIKPFRYAIVYPAMTKHVERSWRSRMASREHAARPMALPAA